MTLSQFNTSSLTAEPLLNGGACRNRGFVNRCADAQLTLCPTCVWASTCASVGAAQSLKRGWNGVLFPLATGKRGGFSERICNEGNPPPKGLCLQERQPLDAEVLRQPGVARRND